MFASVLEEVGQWGGQRLAVRRQYLPTCWRQRHGLEIAGRLFQAWDDFQANRDRAQLLERVAPLRDELKATS